jgi:hypothetical protein
MIQQVQSVSSSNRPMLEGTYFEDGEIMGGINPQEMVAIKIRSQSLLKGILNYRQQPEYAGADA